MKIKRQPEENQGIDLVLLVASTNTGSRSGKNTVAEAMMSHASRQTDYIRPQLMEFSGKIKWICKNCLGLSEEQIRGSLKQEPTNINIAGVAENATPRQIQQYIGTEVFRDKFGDNVWVEAMNREIKEWNESGHFLGRKYSSLVWVADWRFDNERTYLEEQGHNVITINVDKPDNDIGITAHRSDNSLVESIPLMDYNIVNDGSLDDLKNNACMVMDEILEDCGLKTLSSCC